MAVVQLPRPLPPVFARMILAQVGKLETSSKDATLAGLNPVYFGRISAQEKADILAAAEVVIDVKP